MNKKIYMMILAVIVIILIIITVCLISNNSKNIDESEVNNNVNQTLQPNYNQIDEGEIVL